MPFGRRYRPRYRKTNRKSYRKKSYSGRKRFSKYSRKSNRQVTGIPPKKYLKVRKDLLYTFEGVPLTSGWNAIIVGGAQTANLNGYGFYHGVSNSPVDAGIDVTGSTSLAQWFNFYERYHVRGSKVVLSVTSPIDSPNNFVATLVPTISRPLSQDSTATNGFDLAGIDPGELPYAKRIMVNTMNGGISRMSNYCSIKNMLNVRDLEDVAYDGSFTNPYVPHITTSTESGTDFQPTTGANTPGVYWNLVFQNPQQFAVTPGASEMPSAIIRMQITSYICFTNRKPLATV